MKTLRILVYANALTNTKIIEEILKSTSQIEFEIITDDLIFTNKLTGQSFDLLIIDLDLPKDVYKRSQLMTEMVYPAAAYTEMDLNQEDYIRFKIKSLIAIWDDANSDSEVKFFDNPSF